MKGASDTDTERKAEAGGAATCQGSPRAQELGGAWTHPPWALRRRPGCSGTSALQGWWPSWGGGYILPQMHTLLGRRQRASSTLHSPGQGPSGPGSRAPPTLSIATGGHGTHSRVPAQTVQPLLV